MCITFCAVNGLEYLKQNVAGFECQLRGVVKVWQMKKPYNWSLFDEHWENALPFIKQCKIWNITCQNLFIDGWEKSSRVKMDLWRKSIQNGSALHSVCLSVCLLIALALAKSHILSQRLIANDKKSLYQNCSINFNAAKKENNSVVHLLS